MTTDSAEAKAEATREAIPADDGSQLARARDGESIADAPESEAISPLTAITERTQEWWAGVCAEVAAAVEESRFGDLRDRYTERIADSDAAVARWIYRVFFWAVAVPTKALFTLVDRVTDWPSRTLTAVIAFEIFHWLLTGSLWFPW